MEHMTAADGKTAFELGQRLGVLGVLAVGAEGHGLALMLARAAACGAALSGADVLFHDGSSPAAGVWLAGHYECPSALYFLEEEERASLWLRDRTGKPMEWDRLPSAACRVGPAGSWDQMVGTDSSFAAHRVGWTRTHGLEVTVLPAPGQTPLVTALERMGCEVLSRPRTGVPLLRCDRAGFELTVRDGLETTHPEGRDCVDAAVMWCARYAGRQVRPAFGQRTNEGWV